MINWKQYKHITDAYRTIDEFGTGFDGEKLWAELEEQFGAYPDGTGNIWFDTPEGELAFILKYAQNDNTV
jgi:hypothetical protein